MARTPKYLRDMGFRPPTRAEMREFAKVYKPRKKKVTMGHHGRRNPSGSPRS